MFLCTCGRNRRKRKEERGCVCILTNITVLRLFFLFTTLLRCVWSGGAKWTLLMRPEKGLKEGRGGEVKWEREGKGSSVFSSVLDSLGGGGP